MKTNFLGFIGQGWIGKNYSNDLENRGHTVVRYALEAPYNANLDSLRQCDIIFIAVPTPTVPLKGFDDSILRSVLPLVPKGKIAVIKSTMPIGHTKILQNANPDCIVLHSPEFLSERTAAYDAANPDRNIIGMPMVTPEYGIAAQAVLSVLPRAPYELVCGSDEAELMKYTHNVHGYMQVVFANLLYNMAQARHMDWKILVEAFKADPLMPQRYLNPNDTRGRGAGGHCFIKDMEAFIASYRSNAGDMLGLRVLEVIRDKNLEMLLTSGKDLDIVREIYGESISVRRKATAPTMVPEFAKI